MKRQLYELTEEIETKQKAFDILKEILYDGATMCSNDAGKIKV
jgi:hypothetical protein